MCSELYACIGWLIECQLTVISCLCERVFRIGCVRVRREGHERAYVQKQMYKSNGRLTWEVYIADRAIALKHGANFFRSEAQQWGEN